MKRPAYVSDVSDHVRQVCRLDQPHNSWMRGGPPTKLSSASSRRTWRPSRGTPLVLAPPLVDDMTLYPHHDTISSPRDAYSPTRRRILDTKTWLHGYPTQQSTTTFNLHISLRKCVGCFMRCQTSGGRMNWVSEVLSGETCRASGFEVD